MLRYDKMVERALRGVVKEAVAYASERGLPGNHHFYLSFLTQAPGVEIPEYLRTQYPEEMTIVLQYQFYALEALDDALTVMLSFNNIREKLVIPYAAISTFADPSVNFALQFHVPEDQEEGEIGVPRKGAKNKSAAGKSDPDEKRGQVISLESFRKKPVDKTEG